MNYKTVSKKNKKNTGLLVVALVLSLVLVGGAVAGVGYAFDWWSFGEEEVEELPTSTYNVNVSKIDDIIGIEIKEEDLAFVMDEEDIYTQSLEQWESEGANLANKPVAPDYFLINGNLILNIDYFGQEFEKPENGLYDIAFNVNGKEYAFEDVVFDLENKPTGVALMLSVDFETGKLTDEDIMELAFEGVTIIINDTAMCGPTASFNGDAFSIMICYHDKKVDFETFELVKFEKVADLEKEETCTTHVDENDDLLCDVCKANIAE